MYLSFRSERRADRGRHSSDTISERPRLGPHGKFQVSIGLKHTVFDRHYSVNYA